MRPLQFWKECRDRRKVQFILHQQSATDLLKKIERPTPYQWANDEEFEKYFRDLGVYHTQLEWIAEAKKKLEHAERMVELLGGL